MLVLDLGPKRGEITRPLQTGIADDLALFMIENTGPVLTFIAEAQDAAQANANDPARYLLHVDNGYARGWGYIDRKNGRGLVLSETQAPTDPDLVRGTVDGERKARQRLIAWQAAHNLPLSTPNTY